MNQRRIQKIILPILTLLVGFGIGWAVHTSSVTISQVTQVRDNFSGYKFTAPLLYIRVPQDVSVPQYKELKDTVTSYIAQKKNDGDITRTSVYFRDLSSNMWFGIGENEEYAPASLLKVGIMDAFLKLAESDPGLLLSKITMKPEAQDMNGGYQYYPPKNPLQTGETYGTQELLSRMIIESDNNAARAFKAFIGDNALLKTYSDLNVINASSSSSPSQVTATPLTYSRIFRIMYNGTYLSHTLSEEALELLSKTDFIQGIVHGVPAGTIVSHKFGETTLASMGKTFHQLHDCGIVYYPEHPYLLCVMTESTQDFPVLEKVIQDISATAWVDVAKLYPQK